MEEGRELTSYPICMGSEREDVLSDSHDSGGRVLSTRNVPAQEMNRLAPKVFPLL